jgi:hypothetical protein
VVGVAHVSLVCETCKVRIGVSLDGLPAGWSLRDVVREFLEMHTDCKTVIDLTTERLPAE